MLDATQIKEGMVVRSADGEKLGKVLQVSADGFLAEKGFFFPKDYFCRFSDVTEIRDGEILLRHRRDALDKLAREEAVASPESRAEPAGAREPLGARTDKAGGRANLADASEERRIPLAEEEIIAEKETRQAGEVRVRKDIVTEPRQVTVPVTREEVKVDFVPGARGAAAPDSAFKQQEVSVPVMEEDVELRKRAVSRGEARISKEAREDQVSASESVRREEIDVERDMSAGERRAGSTRKGDIEETEEGIEASGARSRDEAMGAGVPPRPRGRS